MALVETTRLLASCGETTALAVLVDCVDDPVDAWVAADGLVLWVDHDDLEVLVGGVLVDPVGVEDAEIGAAAADTLFGGGAEGSLVLQLVDTLVGWLAVGSTLWRRSLAATAADANAVDDIALLSLVALLSIVNFCCHFHLFEYSTYQSASLVGAGWTRCAVDDMALTVPALLSYVQRSVGDAMLQL